MPLSRLPVDRLIEKLHLQPLVGEGGLFIQTYRSAETIPPEALAERYADREKPFCTAILYLLTAEPDSLSALHRLPTDEIYHFYLGDPVEMTLLEPGGTSRQVILGQDVMAGEQVQFVVPAGVWQGSRLRPGGEYALLGTTMAPGYTQGDFEPGAREGLVGEFPQAKSEILRLTRET